MFRLRANSAAQLQQFARSLSFDGSFDLCDRLKPGTRSNTAATADSRDASHVQQRRRESRIGGKPKNFSRSFNRLREKTVGSKNAKIKTCVAPSYPHPSGRMFVRMTRTRTRTYGVIDPSSRQPLLAAMLRAFCWLLSNVVSMLATIFNRTTRDWHTDDAHENQFPTPSDLHNKETSQAEPTGLSTGSGPRAASPAKAGVQTPHSVRTRNPSAPRALTGPPPSRGTRLATPMLALSPLIPTNVGIQGRTRTLSRLAASIVHTRRTRSRIPTPHPERVEGRRNERVMLRKIGLT
jgi:hypothetical protein